VSDDAADRIMFEVYREPGFNRQYRVVYFTELDEHERDAAINAALAGDHFYDGFLAASGRPAAKQVLAAFLTRLNEGGPGTPGELGALLAPFLA
jgi:hypothetical protein